MSYTTDLIDEYGKIDKNCIFDETKRCNGLFCEPHPCQKFLGLSDEKYDKLKEYTIKMEVLRIIEGRQ